MSEMANEENVKWQERQKEENKYNNKTSRAVNNDNLLKATSEKENTNTKHLSLWFLHAIYVTSFLFLRFDKKKENRK